MTAIICIVFKTVLYDIQLCHWVVWAFHSFIRCIFSSDATEWIQDHSSDSCVVHLWDFRGIPTVMSVSFLILSVRSGSTFLLLCLHYTEKETTEPSSAFSPLQFQHKHQDRVIVSFSSLVIHVSALTLAHAYILSIKICTYSLHQNLWEKLCWSIVGWSCTIMKYGNRCWDQNFDVFQCTWLGMTC